MSMLFGPASSDPAVSGLPRGEVLGTYDSYEDARKVVDRLAGQEFDVRTVSIVGVDLRTVERIRHRLTYASVALRSALQGAFFGLMLGILMSLVDPSGAGVQILYTVGLGVGIWVLFGVIGHSIRKGRGFDSVQQLVPTRFDVVCEFASAPQARQILGTGATGPTPAHQPPGAVPTAPASPTTPEDGTGAGPDRQAASAPPAATEPSAAPPDPATGPTTAPAPTPTAASALTPASAAAPAPTPARSHHFPDLPDGRPQFGVRLPEDQARVLRETMLQGQNQNQDQAGQRGATAGAFAAPDYGRGRRGRRKDPDRPVDGEVTAEGTEPASEPTEGRFGRPRYGRHAGRPDAGPGTESGTRPDSEEPARDDSA